MAPLGAITHDRTRPLVIDCDPGIDDAVALWVACASPEMDLVGVTTVCGNVGVEKTTRNALALLELGLRPDIPVHVGADRPLVRSAPRRAEHVHGENGLGGIELQEPAVAARPGHAVDFLADVVRREEHPVTLVAIGPLTNVALFYARYPHEASRLGRVVVMGGSAGAGNTTPAAEFNIWFDPEAAHRVLADPGLPVPVPTTVVTLETTYRTVLDRERLGRLRSSGWHGAMLADALEHYLLTYRELLGRDVVAVHDAVALVEALRPGLVTTRRVNVEIDTGTGPGRGNTIVDLWNLTGAPATAEVGVDVDVAGVTDLILDRVAWYRDRPGTASVE